MKLRLIFYFTNEVKNSISALCAGMIYRGIYDRIDVRFVESEDELVGAIGRGVVNLVAFSITTVNFYERYRTFLRLKKLTKGYGDIYFIAGGPHADGDPDSLLLAGFDFVFSGYCEDGFSSFLKDFLFQNRVASGQKIVCTTSQLWRERSFAKLFNNYFPPLEIQRGCRYRCTYCQSCVRMKRQIYKSRDAIDEYIRDFLSLGFSRFSFVSPDAFDLRFVSENRSPDNLIALFEYLTSKKIRLIEYGQFPSEIRPNRDVDEFFKALSRYTKNRKIVIGAQSFEDHRLKKIKRGHTASDIEQTMESAARYGFYSIVDIILGFPDETEEERIYTLNRFRELNKRFPSRLHVHYFLPLAGTEMYASNPSRLDKNTLDLLNKLERDGRAKGWWKEGERMVRRIIRMREKFSNN